MALQAIFAVLANSKSMMADCEAMSVDALTYLFNLCAERIKSRPYSQEEINMPKWKRIRTRKLKRLYLELVPPLISVSTLMVVTILVLKDSLATLYDAKDSTTDDEVVDVHIMLFFSTLNLVLDIVNVTCFAKAKQAFGFNSVLSSGGHAHGHEHSSQVSLRVTEKTPLVTQLSYGGIEVQLELPPSVEEETSEEEKDKDGVAGLNLNMCSAWTVSSFLACLFPSVITIITFVSLMNISFSKACLRRHTPIDCCLDCGRDCHFFYRRIRRSGRRCRRHGSIYYYHCIPIPAISWVGEDSPRNLFNSKERAWC